jgi:hypothetical protein
VTYRFAVGIVVLLAGCPVGSADDQGEIDAGGTVDTPNGTSGLTVTWGITPDVPGPAASDLRVDEVRLQTSSLRLIGDSAAPGDMRTTRAPVDLRWRNTNNMNEAPPDVELNAAPSGLYSRIELGTGGSNEHLTIKGEVRLDGEWKDFEIEDERPHAIVKNIVLTLAPGQHKTIPITMDVAVVLAAVPFDQLPSDDGTVHFPDDDPRLDAVWAAVEASFTVPTGFLSRD